MNDEPAPEEAQGPGLSRSVGHRILDGASDKYNRARVWLGRWFLPLVLAIVALLVEIYIYLKVGGIAVIASLVMALAISPLIYKAINVYYAYVMTVDLNSSDGTLTLGFIDVPRDRAHEIKVRGSRGYVKDQSGSDIMLVSKFDPETLQGVGTWPGNLTPLQFAARWKTAREVVKNYETLTKRYGIASIQARLDALADHIQVAETATGMLKLPDLDLQEEFKTEGDSGGDNGSAES